jgi:membrane protease YdiL (CAAX protease family)
MNKIYSERAQSQEIPQASVSNRALLIVTAWLATLFLSKLPLVIARDVLGTDIPWITPAWIGAAVLLYAATYVWSGLKPLRGYFMVMGLIVLLVFGLEPIVRGTTLWQDWSAGQAPMIVLLGERALVTIEALLVMGFLLLRGMKRQDLYLAVGNLKAPVVARNSKRKWSLSWAVFAPVMALLLGGMFFVFLQSQNSGQWNWTPVLAWLPVILISAALNAFGEEAMYRAAPLATLVRVIGPVHALVLTSLWFGLGHYYGGIPSGPFGLVQSGLLALLLGKAMLDTRGLGWSWVIHLVLDTVIYMAIAMSLGA